MARIVNADKSEVLRSISIDEYGNKATFSSRSGSGTLSVNVKDPKRAERESLRSFIENLVNAAEDDSADLIGRGDILAELDKRDEDATQKWGERLPNDFSISFWLEPSVMAAIANVYDDGDLSTDVRVAIREALSGDAVNTKGF